MNVLVEKQSKKAHVLHPVHGGQGTRGRQQHRAYGEEHDRRHDAAKDSRLRPLVAHKEKDRSSPLGEADQVRAYIRPEHLELPADR